MIVKLIGFALRISFFLMTTTMMTILMLTQTAKQSRCCSQMLEAAADCVHGQSKKVDELLGWTSETLSVLTTNFNAVQLNDLKSADLSLKQHVVR